MILREKVESYLKQTLDRFGLGHVEYTLTTTNGKYVDEDNHLGATVQVENRGMDAHFYIAVGGGWKQVQENIIHECLHVATWELRNGPLALGEVLSSEGYLILRQQTLDAEERLVVRLTRGIMGATR